MHENQVVKHYLMIRQQTETICQPLEVEDYVIQSMDDVSPPKWHLAHTTWFFETFILIPHDKNYKVYHAEFKTLFNSYYQSLSRPNSRNARGLLSRPTVKTIYDYRHHVDRHLCAYLDTMPVSKWHEVAPLLDMGLAHEEQHQELLLMDIKYNYSLHYPHVPVYQKSTLAPSNNLLSDHRQALDEYFIFVKGGQVSLGFVGEGFSFDNERPAHPILLAPYRIANRLVTNGEYLAFIDAGGYKNPIYWLADGWDYVQRGQLQAPLYWYETHGQWHELTLQGLQPLVFHQPVCHVSYYEADAYARWREKRLPTEAEWEHGVTEWKLQPQEGNFLENHLLHPAPAVQPNMPQQFFGDLWEWTTSAYAPYPGYQTYSGVLSEYNGKFMCNQMVLRGGSCVTPRSHIRTSYRNFFQPEKRWPFVGFRLAENV